MILNCFFAIHYGDLKILVIELLLNSLPIFDIYQKIHF